MDRLFATTDLQRLPLSVSCCRYAVVDDFEMEGLVCN